MIMTWEQQIDLYENSTARTREKRSWLNETKKKIPKWFWETSKIKKKSNTRQKEGEDGEWYHMPQRGWENNIQCYLDCPKLKSENKTSLILDAWWGFISFPIMCPARTWECRSRALVLPFAMVFKIMLTLSSLENMESKPSKRPSQELTKSFPSW